MKFWLLAVLAFITLSASAQFDPTKLTYYRYKYGDRLHNIQADSAMVPPSDTSTNKTGIALKNGTFYVGNGTYWSEVTGEGGSIGPFSIGSVLFADSSGDVSEENTALKYNITAKRLGVGTATPWHKLSVKVDTAFSKATDKTWPNFFVDNSGQTAGEGTRGGGIAWNSLGTDGTIQRTKAGIVSRQTTSDPDVVGLDFLIHRSETATDSLDVAMSITHRSIGIGTEDPATSSALDVSSTTKGVLLPRMTTAQRAAISSPANALIVFDTELSKYYYYDSTNVQWQELGSSSSESTVVYKDGTLLTGDPGDFANPMSIDTTNWIATKTDVVRDSLVRTEGIDSIQIYRDGVHIYSIKDSTGGAGSGDDWGAAFVRTDATLTGKGTQIDTLKVDTTVMATKSYVDNLPGITPPDGSETKIVAGNGIAVTGDGTSTSQYVITNTGTSGSNPHNALSILNYGGVADAVVGSTSVTGTDNTPALAAMLNAASDGQLCIIPSGDYLFKTVLDTIQGSKSVNLLILGDTWHQNASGEGIDFIILANASGPTEQHTIVHLGECTGEVGIPSFSSTTYAAGTGPVWSSITGTPFKIYNSNQQFIKFNRVQGFKNGVEVIGWDYDAASPARGCEENIIEGRIIQNCANGVVTTSINGNSYVDKTYFRGWGGGKMTIRCGLAIKVDGYSGTSEFADPITGVQEVYNGAFRSNEYDLLIERCDSVAEVHGDVTDNIFNVTIEGSGVHSNIGWRMRVTSPNVVRDPRFSGGGVYSYLWMNEGNIGTNAQGTVPIWWSTPGRNYGNNWRTDGSSKFYFIGSAMSKFQRDDSPSWMNFAPASQYEKDVTTTAATYSAVAGEVIRYNHASGTLTLPSAGSNVQKWIWVKNIHPSNALTISNGDISTLASGQTAAFRSDGTSWKNWINASGSGGGGGGDSTFTDDAAGRTTSYKLGIRAPSSSSTSTVFPASTTSVSSFRIATGAHPTSPADGDEWRVAAARYMAYNGVTYQYLTVPDNGVAGQVVRRNAANDGYEHAYANYILFYSGTASASATTTSSSGNSFIGGSKTITGGLAAGDVVELKGSGIFTLGGSSASPSIDFVVGSQTIHVGLGSTFASLNSGKFTYHFRAIPTTTGTNVTTLIEYKVTFNNESTGVYKVLENATSVSALNTTTPIVNAIGYWSTTGCTMTSYVNTVEVKRK